MGLKNSCHLANPGVNAWASGKTRDRIRRYRMNWNQIPLDFFSNFLGLTSPTPDEVSRRPEKNYPEADRRPADLRGNCV